MRALEKGYLQKIFVDEGQSVKQGQMMFQIMPLIYNAELQKAQAEANFAEIEYQNTKSLADSNVVSKNELAMAKAKFDKAKAELALAQTHLQFTEIRAPFDGIMDHFQVRLGSLVDEGDLLTTLSDNSKMWVYFNVPEAEYLNYKANIKKDSMLKVKLVMANHELFNHPGIVETIEADFNNETGNIAFRATFPNPNALLRHGETGNIQVVSPIKNALIIPQKATFEVLEKKYVYVIDQENKVKSREISVVAELPHIFIVGSGLKPTDKILLEGLRQVRENEKIDYTIVKPDSVISNLGFICRMINHKKQEEMFSKFIKRPVFAIVISVVIIFVGLLAIKKLPISQFPDIAPTTVNIFIAYPGSSADVLVQSTLITLEQAINGVQDMRYIATDATSAGEATLRIIFEPGTDPNDAVIRVKTRVDQVMPLLPELVQREGVIITPIQPSMLMYVNLYSKEKSIDEKFLFNYATVKMIPEIQRTKGCSKGANPGKPQVRYACLAES